MIPWNFYFFIPQLTPYPERGTIEWSVYIKYSWTKSNLLWVCPIHSCWTQKEACPWVVKPAIRLLATTKRWHQCFVWWDEPINDRAFETLGIICPRAGSALLNLHKCEQGVRRQNNR